MKNMLKILASVLFTTVALCGLIILEPLHTPERLENEQEESHARFTEDEFSYAAAQFYDISKQVEQMPNDKAERSINTWEFIGPDTMRVNDSLNFCGRARCVRTFVPQNQFDLGIRVSTGSGGLWNMKQDANGEIVAESIQGDLPILDIAAFDIHPFDANIMIAGTGEPTAGKGVGMFKTTDGGQHWWRIDTTHTIPDWYHKILFNPEHPDTILVAASNGLLSSIDGGDSWYQFYAGDFTDIAFNPVHADTCYAIRKGGNFYMSTNGTYSFSSSNAPTSTIGHGCLAVAPSATNVLYACITTGTSGNAIYKSVDYGGTWTACNINYVPGQTGFHGNQAEYNNCITVKPTDANVVIAAGTYFARSVDGFNFNAGFENDGHNDHHGFAWRSDGSLLDANDGGLFLSYDDGANMKSTLNYLPVAQFYEYDLSDNSPNTMLGALQDNWTVLRALSGGNWIWKSVNYGDGFSSAVNQSSALDMMANNNGALLQSFNGGNNWTVPAISGSSPNGYNQPRYERSIVAPSPNQNGVWVFGGKQLFRRDSLYNWSAVNNGNEFSSNIVHFSLGNRNNPGVRQNVLVSMPGTDTNKVYIRDRHNGLWYDITNNLPNLGGEEYRTATAYYNDDVSYAYVLRGANMGKVFMNSDIGVSNWIDITGNLPAGIRINCLTSNPSNPNEVFIGTYRFGVFRTIVGSNTWTLWNNGWPGGMDISAMKVVDSSSTTGKKYLVASSYGRGIWRREMSGEDPQLVASTAKETGIILNDFPILKTGADLPVRFKTELSGMIQIDIFDMHGARIKTINRAFYEAGQYGIVASSTDWLPGIYFCVLTINDNKQVSKKFVMVN